MYTSRERVLRAVNFQQADRVPIDLGSMLASGISAFAYRRLKAYLGLKGGHERLTNPKLMLCSVEEPVLRRFHADVVGLSGHATLPWREDRSERYREWSPRPQVSFEVNRKLIFEPSGDGGWWLLNHQKARLFMPSGGFYFDELPSDGPADAMNLEDFNPPDTIPDEELDLIARRGKWLYDNTDYAILGEGYGADLFSLNCGGYIQWMMALLTEKQYCHEMLAKAADAAIERLKLIHQAVGDRCFAWVVAADDAGTQNGPMVSPDLYAEMIAPHFRKVNDWVHRNTRMKTFIHCCGSIYDLIPILIDCGFDILNPVQTSAANMDPAGLKKAFGGRIVFWGGGCDTQSILGRAEPDRIREHVRRRIEVFAPGGGFVFNQVHNIQADVPPENIIAMLDAAWEYGGYNS